MAKRHKHLAGAHVFIISGRIRTGNVLMHAGDYIYEPSGVMHEATTAIEKMIHVVRWRAAGAGSTTAPRPGTWLVSLFVRRIVRKVLGYAWLLKVSVTKVSEVRRHRGRPWLRVRDPVGMKTPIKR